MKYNKTSWTDGIKKAVKDLNTSKVTAGRVCAVATIRFIRDALIDDLVGGKTDEELNKIIFTGVDLCDSIKDSLNELIKEVSKDTDSGFASNSSAAAKAAGFKSDNLPESDSLDS
jgi:hypothetical protein